MDAVAAATELATLARERAGEGEAACRLPADVVAALRHAGLFSMSVPAVYGGPEVPPLEQVRAVEALAASDGAAAWCVAISSTTSSMSWFLADEWARVVFADPLAAYGGAFAPTGQAVEVDEGWQCTGRWSWGSGTQHCQWINGGCLTDTGEMHLMFFEAGQVEILDTWNPNGLRATGSHDFRVAGARVPAGRSVRPGVDRHVVECALARFPNFNYLAGMVAAVTLGIARHAIDELVALAMTKTPLLARSRLSEYAPAQLDVARAEAMLGSAGAFLHDEIAAIWELAQSAEKVPVERRARLRLACAHAASEAAAAVDRCYHAAGGSSVLSTHPLARCFRDVHTATQHLMLSDRNVLTYGRLRFGLETDTAML